MLVVQVNAQISIQNAGFETWTSPQMPTNWNTHGFNPYPDVHQSNVAHSGSSSLKLSVAKYGTGVGGADIYSAYAISSSSTLPLYYSFWAKVHLGGADKLGIDADVFKKPSSLILTGIPYGLNVIDASKNTTVWTQFTFTLQANSTPPADSISLRFYFYTANDTSSYVLIDDLAFTSGPTVIQDLTKQPIIENAYPNPANTLQTIVYSVDKSSSIKLEAYDLLGNMVSTILNETQLEGKYKTEIDVRDYVNGLYSIVLSIDGQSFSQKMMVYH
jgi:hypothetical protein